MATVNNIVHHPLTATTHRNMTLADKYREGEDVEYIFDQFAAVREAEVEANEQCRSDKQFFMAAWSVADHIQMKLDLMEDKGSNQAQIWNRSELKQARLNTIRWFHTTEDLVTRGLLRRSVAICRIQSILFRTRKLLDNRKLRMASGHSWSKLAGLYNNGLSTLENLDVKVHSTRYIKNKFTGKLCDHECPEEEEMKEGRQDRDGNDWQEEISRMFYQLD